MLYTEKEKHEIERVKEVFAEHLRQDDHAPHHRRI